MAHSIETLKAGFDFDGRTAIVTGGSRGIGLAIAQALASCGAKVVVSSRKAEACDAAVARIRAEGGTAAPGASAGPRPPASGHFSTRWKNSAAHSRCDARRLHRVIRTHRAIVGKHRPV